MPKAKATQAQMDAANGAQLDPIIDALLEHLPAPGDYWSKEERKRWLQMMELSFDMIYVEEATDEPEPSETPASMRAHGG